MLNISCPEGWFDREECLSETRFIYTFLDYERESSKKMTNLHSACPAVECGTSKVSEGL